MFVRVRDSHVKSFGKAVSWRIVGSIDTFVLSLLVTGSIVAAGSVASLETISKVILYYLHERVWSFCSSRQTTMCVLAAADEHSDSAMPTPSGDVCADAPALQPDAPTSAPSPLSARPSHTPPNALQRGLQHADVDRE